MAAMAAAELAAHTCSNLQCSTFLYILQPEKFA